MKKKMERKGQKYTVYFSKNINLGKKECESGGGGGGNLYGVMRIRIILVTKILYGDVEE